MQYCRTRIKRAFLVACALCVIAAPAAFAASCERIAVDQVRTEIAALAARDTTPSATRDKLEDVGEYLAKYGTEMDKTPPDSVAALGAIEGAIGDLESAFQSLLVGSDDRGRWTAALLEAAETTVVKAIAAAESDPSGDSGKLAKSRELQAEARTLRTSGHLKAAAAKLKAALAEAESATKVRPAEDHLPCGQNIVIDSPSVGAFVTTAAIHVTGTLTASTRNVGVLVNDTRAELDLGHAGTSNDPFRWFATVSTSPGSVELKAQITTPETMNGGGAGNGRTASVQVQFSPSASVHLVPSSTSGMAPLRVSFTVHHELQRDQITRFEADLDGNGIFELSSTAVPETFEYTYQSAGLRVAVIRLTAEGRVVEGRSPVVVQSFPTLNRLLKEVWAGFVAALSQGNVADGSSYFSAGAPRDRYRPVLELIEPSLNEFAAGIRNIAPIWIRGDVAYYLLTRSENGVDKGYYVYFARDANGLWKIVMM